jgi:iron complex transport system ATP-binding protein
MSIRAEEITVRYPRAMAPAVHHVSLTLGAGELVVVAGPNGSGKSSVFRALLGIIAPEQGRVLVDDRPVASWRRSDLARVVAALPQREEPVFPLHVRDAVLMGRWARLGPVAPVTSHDRAALDRAMARCNLVDLADRGTDTLSGGEWQRVRVARALAAEPRFLLLDEPGTALDLAHEMALFELLRALVAEGIGVLAITHHLNLALRYADRVVLFDRGAVAADGAPSEVLTEALLSRVFRWPVSLQSLDDGTPHLVPLRRDEMIAWPPLA